MSAAKGTGGRARGWQANVHGLATGSVVTNDTPAIPVRAPDTAKPIDRDLLRRLAQSHDVLITIEEGSTGGFGALCLTALAEDGLLDRGLAVRTMTLPDLFLDHDKPERLYARAGLDAKGVVAKALEALGKDEAALRPRIVAMTCPLTSGAAPLTPRQRDGVARAMAPLKEKARNFSQILARAHFVLTERPIGRDEKAEKSLDPVSRRILGELTPHLQNASWDRERLEAIVSDVAATHGLGLGKIAPSLRAALAGRAVSPSVFDMMLVLGRDETLARLSDAAAGG